MIKADELWTYEGENGKEIKESFTNFELLQMEVEALKDSIDEIVEILRYNNLKRKETIFPEYFDKDKVFRKLDKEKNG